MGDLKTKIEVFVNKNTNIFVSIMFFLLGAIILHKFLGINAFSLYIIGISCIVILILGKIKVTEYLFSSIGVVIIIINLIVVILSLVPSYNKNVDISGFYDQQKNYIKIDIQDEKKSLEENKAKIIILNKQTKTTNKREYDLSTPNIENQEIELFTGDVIYYQAKSKKLNTVINIYLWDGSIIRILPQTTLRLQKLLKNTKDLFSSQTEVEVEKGSIWFNVIKTIKDENSFRIKTKEGNIVIRGTAGLVSQNDETQEMTVYSMNHIIQVEDNNGKTELIGKLESMLVSSGDMKGINLGMLSDILGEDFINKIKDQTFVNMDQKDINVFKGKIQSYATQEFGWIFDGQSSLESVGKFKLELFGLIDENSKKSLENLNKYSLIKNGGSNNEMDKQGRQELIDSLTNITKQQDMLFVSTNEAVDEVKMKMLKESASYNIDWFKTYLISSYNKLLDQGKSVDLSKIKNTLENTKSGLTEKLFELENKLQQGN